MMGDLGFEGVPGVFVSGCFPLFDDVRVNPKVGSGKLEVVGVLERVGCLGPSGFVAVGFAKGLGTCSVVGD